MNITDDERDAWRNITSSVLWLLRLPIYPLVCFGAHLRGECVNKMALVEWLICAAILLWLLSW